MMARRKRQKDRVVRFSLRRGVIGSTIGFIPKTGKELIVLAILIIIVYAGYIGPLASRPEFLGAISGGEYRLSLVINQIEGYSSSPAYVLRMIVEPIAGVMVGSGYNLTLGAPVLMPESAIMCENAQVLPAGPVIWNPGIAYNFSIRCYGISTEAIVTNATFTIRGPRNETRWYGYKVYRAGTDPDLFYTIFYPYESLPAGNYTYNWTAAGSNGQNISTTNLNYIVLRNETIIRLMIDDIEGDKTVDVGNNVTISATSNNPNAVITLYIDGTAVAAGVSPSKTINTTQLGVAPHIIRAATPGNQNWTSADISYTLTVTGISIVTAVTPASGAIYNPAQSYTFFVNISPYPDAPPAFELDGSIITSYQVNDRGSGRYDITLPGTQLSAGIHTYRWWAYHQGQQHSTPPISYIVSEIPTRITLMLNGTEGNRDYLYSQSALFNAVANVSNVMVRLIVKDPDNNTVYENTGTTSISNTMVLNAIGNWTIFAEIDQLNYQRANATYIASVHKVPVSLRLFLDGTEGNRIYPLNTVANFIAVANVTDVTVRLVVRYPDNNIAYEYTNPTSVSYMRTLSTAGVWSIFAEINNVGYENYNVTYYAIVGDVQSPRWFNQQQSQSVLAVGATNYLSANFTDNSMLSSATLETNETGVWENISTVSLSGTSDFANFSWQNPSLPLGTAVGWRIWVRDFAGNVNVTDVMSFSITPDIDAPAFSNVGQSNSSVIKGTPNMLRAYWTDNVGVKWAWLMTDEVFPGRLDVKYNYGSPMLMNIPQGWSNFSWLNEDLSVGRSISWKICANDSAGNSACTPVSSFVVVEPPQYPIVLSDVCTFSSSAGACVQGFAQNEVLQIRLNFTNNGPIRPVLLIATAIDPNGVRILSTSYSTTISGGATLNIQGSELSMLLNGVAGTWEVRVAAYSNWPHLGGAVIGVPYSTTITVIQP